MLRTTHRSRNSKTKGSKNGDQLPSMSTRSNDVDNQHVCSICKKVLSSKGNLVQHMDTHVGVDEEGNPEPLSTFDCKDCGKSFFQKRYLLRHQTRCPIKKKVKLHHCGLCGKIFSRLSHLRRHEAHHLRQNPFVCTICERAFVQQHHLERHFQSLTHQQNALQLQHAAEDGKQLSPPDGQESAAPVVLSGNAFTSSQRHKCPFCSKAFPTAWEMQRHWRTLHPYAIRRTVASATSQEPAKTTFLLKCSRCGVRFDNDLLYQNHLEWHQGKRPCKCDRCGFAFHRRLELDNHKAAKHGTGWIFECVECAKKFPQRTEVDRHINAVHASIDSRSASIARRRYALVRQKFGGRAMLHCKYCDAKTYNVADYRDHITLRHFRKVFVEEAPLDNLRDRRLTVAGIAPSSSGHDPDERSSIIKLIVTVAPASQPVRLLQLGPRLPEWLLKLQPSYAMLDVALDEDGQALGPGERIVLQLPVSPKIPGKNIVSKTIRVAYSS